MENGGLEVSLKELRVGTGKGEGQALHYFSRCLSKIFVCLFVFLSHCIFHYFLNSIIFPIWKAFFINIWDGNSIFLALFLRPYLYFKSSYYYYYYCDFELNKRSIININWKCARTSGITKKFNFSNFTAEFKLLKFLMMIKFSIRITLNSLFLLYP